MPAKFTSIQKLRQVADLQRILDVIVYVFIQGRTRGQVQFVANG